MSLSRSELHPPTLGGRGDGTAFLGDLAALTLGDLDLLPSSKPKLRFRLTICLVFLGDLPEARSFFLALSLVLVAAILPVVTVFPPFLSSLRDPTVRSI